MADQPISSDPKASDIAGTEMIPIVKDGANERTDPEQPKPYILTDAVFPNTAKFDTSSAAEVNIELQQGSFTNGRIRVDNAGNLFLSGRSSTMYLRPNGDADSTGEFSIQSSGDATLNGKLSLQDPTADNHAVTRGFGNTNYATKSSVTDKNYIKTKYTGWPATGTVTPSTFSTIDAGNSLHYSIKGSGGREVRLGIDEVTGEINVNAWNESGTQTRSSINVCTQLHAVQFESTNTSVPRFSWGIVSGTFNLNDFDDGFWCLGLNTPLQNAPPGAPQSLVVANLGSSPARAFQFAAAHATDSDTRLHFRRYGQGGWKPWEQIYTSLNPPPSSAADSRTWKKVYNNDLGDEETLPIAIGDNRVFKILVGEFCEDFDISGDLFELFEMCHDGDVILAQSGPNNIYNYMYMIKKSNRDIVFRIGSGIGKIHKVFAK